MASSITPAAEAARAEPTPARRGNPDVSNTAARYIAKAMTKVAPWQVAELLASMVDQASDAQAYIVGGVAA